ncbi:MAG: cache domain-containing protein [Proteobacteria bacterium]|nr:cache domain-containing protein [Pseudomonadota bacterium]MBU1641379.1 cache domain-containing protein [Pseudomonadota bacterium]
MLKSLKARILLLITGTLVITSTAFVLLTQKDVVSAMFNAQEELARNVLHLVMLQIESEHENLHFYEDAMLSAYKTKLKDIITIQEKTLRHAYDNAKATASDEETVKKKILEELRSYRFGNNDYIWISDYNSVLISHPDTRLHGIDYSTVTDVNGKLIVPPMVEQAKDNGEGYYSYWWRKLQTAEPVEKITYFKLFPEWQWVIGTGVYVDDIQKESDRKLSNILENLRKTFSKITIGRTGYLYIFNGKREMLVHPLLEGVDITDLRNPSTGNRILDDLIQASATPEVPMEYLWNKPFDKDNFRYMKEAYVAHFAPLDWYICSSVYKDEIMAPVVNLSQKILYTSLALFVIAICLSLLFSQTLVHPLKNLVEAMKAIKEKGLSHTKVEVGGATEISELGDIFNTMIDSLNEAHNELENRVKDRTSALSKINTHLLREIDERRNAEKTAAGASKAKSEFLATMSHEIRTPLNAIIGMADILKETTLTREQDEYVGIFKSAGGNLLQLINDILDISKVEAGKLALEIIDFNLEEVVKKACEVTAVRAHQKNIELLCQISPEIPVRLQGDPCRLRQVLINLLGNAVKYCDQGEVLLRLELQGSTNGECLLQFAISDTGIGIPLEKRALIFDSFTQADSSTTRKYGGTGLGLSISRKIIELMGGRIWLESTEQLGSTFYFTATFRALANEENAARPALAAPGKRTLLIDDNATSRLILKESLLSWAIQVTEAESGPDALAELQRAREASQPYDLLLLDGHMVPMGGLEVLTRMTNDHGAPPAIIMMFTSDKMGEQVSRARQLGAATCLMKPLLRHDLYRAVMAALAGEKTCCRAWEAKAKALPAAAHPMPPLQALLVEDDEINQKMTVRLLKKAGHTVTVAASGHQALALLAATTFDFILMDVQMPEMDGLETTALIRAKERSLGTHTPIIAFTAFAFQEDKARCLEAGMDDYLSKPLDKDAFFKTIKRVLPLARQPVFERDQALKSVDGDQEFLQELAQILVNKGPADLATIRNHITAQQSEMLMRSAHTLKVELAALCAPAAHGVARGLEIMGRQHDLRGAQAECDRLEHELARLRDQLQTFLTEERG